MKHAESNLFTYKTSVYKSSTLHILTLKSNKNHRWGNLPIHTTPCMMLVEFSLSFDSP